MLTSQGVISKPLEEYEEEHFEGNHSRVYWLKIAQCGHDNGFLFLDRDGVLNNDKGYVGKVSNLELLPGIVEAIRYCLSQGISLAVVTNQSGIGRHFYSWQDFETVCDHIAKIIRHDGAPFEAIAACACVPDDRNDTTCSEWRKPGPKMITTICDRLRIDRSRSWLVGDRLSDIQAAARAELGGAIQIGDTTANVGQSTSAFCHYGAQDAASAIEMAAGLIIAHRNFGQEKSQ
ncbi:D-glycero-alpha-D-manno-heptose-1,7-bisphosphate 7-phosphatase (plasmid) [Rhizobium leguminosarum]